MVSPYPPQCADIASILFPIKYIMYYRNTAFGRLKSSPRKENVVAEGSRSPLPANRTSPIGVPIPGNPGLRQRNDSTSSTDSWQLVSGTGSLRGSTTLNAPHIESALSATSDCKPHCKTCTPGHRMTPPNCTSGRGLIAENAEEVSQ